MRPDGSARFLVRSTCASMSRSTMSLFKRLVVSVYVSQAWRERLNVLVHTESRVLDSEGDPDADEAVHQSRCYQQSRIRRHGSLGANPLGRCKT